MKTLIKGLLGFIGAAVVSAVVVRMRTTEYGGPHDPRFSLAVAIGGRDYVNVSNGLTSGRAVAYLGGIAIDLTQARPAPGARISLTAVCGGIDVVVPEDWRVEVLSSATMGEVVNATDPDDPTDGPLVLVDARAVMGGVSIRTPRPDGTEDGR
ncbi:MAG: hypothetical protein KDB69_02895 [Acidimicrobiia bacterium]|nr:hypothetical protein [Acidimicrobiia bacterium]